MRTAQLALALTLLATLATPAVAQPGPRGCVDPADYGAIPNDGRSDRVAIQTAINLADGGGTVCIGAGRWTCDRAGPGAYSRTACLATHGRSITITGTGPGTVIELMGDQGLQQTILIAIEPGARNIRIERMTLSTRGSYRTEEQTHVIATTSNRPTVDPPYDTIEGLTIEAITCDHPPPIAGERKGDCIRLGSNARVIDTKIIGSTFVGGARSFIELQRNVYTAKIIANTFRGEDGDQDIDGEATGGGWIYDIQIIANTFEDGPRMQGDYSVSLTSAERVIVADNIFRSRGLILVRSIDAHVHHNIFDATMRYAEQGVIESANRADGLTLDHNTIRRRGAPGFAIRVQPHGLDGPPTGVRITDHRITVDGDSSGIYVASPVDLRIERNDVVWTASAAPNGHGILVSAISRPAVGVRIEGNATTGGAYYAAVRVTAAIGMTYTALRVTGNESRGGTRSLRCEQAAPWAFAMPVVTGGNMWAVPPACASSGASLVAGE